MNGWNKQYVSELSLFAAWDPKANCKGRKEKYKSLNLAIEENRAVSAVKGTHPEPGV